MCRALRQLIPLMVTLLALMIFRPVRAADHGDAPRVASDQAADLADCFLFLDPNDNTRIVLIATFRGFIVPGEAVNFGIYDPSVRYRFEIENTGDAIPDLFIDVQFDRRTNSAVAQTATVMLPDRTTFTARATNPSLAASPPGPVLTTNEASGTIFFAGEVDDPFFFDIPGFSRFVASVRAGTPDPTQLNRGRNTFAGYNVMAIAMSMPVSQLKGDGNVIGLDVLAQRRNEKPTALGDVKSTGKWRTVDREGNPAVNVVLVPFGRKDEYNASSTRDDAAGKFVNDIGATLLALGTSADSISVLANIAVIKGDFLHLDTTVPNTGSGGGNNNGAGFPNGRRMQDDVVDTLLFVVTNGAITEGDHVDANDVPFRDAFPFLAPPQQPFAAGVIDDNTRN